MAKKSEGMSNAVKITGIVALAVVLIVALTLNTLEDAKDKKTVQVTGEAQVDVEPDEVIINFNIETSGATAQEAKDENNKITSLVTSNLLKAGYSGADIQTSGFNIWEEYDWSRETRESIGFKATHQISVQVPSNGEIGKTVDAGVDAGALIGYINFGLSQELQNKYKAEAIKLASQDARVKAEAMAEGLGTRIDDLISVTNSDFNYYPWAAFDTAMMAKADSFDGAMVEETLAATDIRPGERTVSARVQAVYELE